MKPQDKDNERHVADILVVTNALLLPNLDIVDNTKIEALEREMEVIKMKYDSLVHVVEGLRQQLLRISHHLNILDASYQGEQYSYTLQ